MLSVLFLVRKGPLGGNRAHFGHFEGFLGFLPVATLKPCLCYKFGKGHLYLAGRFGPEKKIFSPHPPKFPSSPQTPSRPLGPSPGTPPPLSWDFQYKTDSPPSPPSASDPPPLPEQKKIKISETSTKLFRSLGTTPISGKTLSEKGILGALGEFRGILGATLRIQKLILGIRNSILGMASHDLSMSNTKTTILGATPGAAPGIGGNPHERFSFAPAFSERFFKHWGGPRASD